MNKLRYSTLGLILLASSSFAAPYIGVGFGMVNIKSAKSTVDTAVKRLALGYAFNYDQGESALSLIGEIGVNDGVSYDAGQLGRYVDNHAQVHIGSGLDGLVGVGWRQGRFEVSLLGGMRKTKISVDVESKQDTLSKMQPLGSLRIAYYLTRTIKLGLSVNHAFGKSGSIYAFNPHTTITTLKHAPSITTYMVGLQIGLV